MNRTGSARHAPGARRAGERGDMNIEAAVVSVAVLLLLALVYTGGQIVTAENAVQEAARAAARAASISRDATTAAVAASARAQQVLGRQLNCQSSAVDIDAAQFSRPVGEPAAVTATVTCTVAFASLTVPGTPGTRTLSATFTSAIDRFSERGGPT